jgi:hypothetical protein
MKKLITKKDFILLVVVLIVGVAGIFLVNSAKKGTIAIIKIDGKAVAEIPIQDEYYELNFNGVTVCCENSEMFVKESSCPDKVCVRSGRISKTGEGIICAPNRVAVEISGKNQLDALTG